MVLQQIFQLLNTAMIIYGYLLIIYIFMSWFPGARESSFGIFLGRISEPYLEVFRRFIPPLGMIDFSPIVAILILNFARTYGLSALFSFLIQIF
ncbi:YggT family protein [Cerasibacillus quisquiliarum]|uniref:Membrane protein n=1 Tax=Cerasibacillus quisquiliarum TaxID=227865 RepID=A0A511UUS4_9BACI|nr:YggT family protein [Cerasibacillus quisquiliarum]MBB5145784.1 YggT family protein [Cerasibacillus quisquiliarum]GEN30355.1 membrane protein [Cerasibacillus quisquiliarum]